MDEHLDDNQIVDSKVPLEEYDFENNFISTPWDDRSSKSKFGIVALLSTIFITTMACVIGSLFNHYKEHSVKMMINSNEINCLRVKMEKYSYIARIHSAATQDLLCIGALVSPTSILANGACVKSGPVRVHMGTLLRCKNGFPVDVVESLSQINQSVDSKRLVLLSSYDHIGECGRIIKIGRNLDWEAKVHVIGRPEVLRKRFSLQHVTLVVKESVSIAHAGLLATKPSNMICVKDLARCPVHVGDLLVQNGQLFGLATSSVLRTDQFKQACFANLSNVLHDLRELDSNIISDSP